MCECTPVPLVDGGAELETCFGLEVGGGDKIGRGSGRERGTKKEYQGRRINGMEGGKRWSFHGRNEQ